MAPTEILAEQHFINFNSGSPLGIQCAWLAGKLKAKEKRKTWNRSNPEMPSVVSTHALFQEQVNIKNWLW